MQNPVERHRADYPQRSAYGSEETTGCGTRGVYFDDRDNGRMASLNRVPDERDSCLNRIAEGGSSTTSAPGSAASSTGRALTTAASRTR